MTMNFVEKIHWLGHDSFRIDGSRTLYFDPFQIEGGPGADLIFISHDHFDHCSPEDVEKIRKENTVIITEKDSARKLKGDIRVLKPGENREVEGVKIEAVPAYNTDKDFHPRKNGWLGFIVEMDGVRVYHAGDTDFVPEMNGIKVDIALLPVSGTYVMTAKQAVAAAKAIRPRVAIPMHYGAIVGDEKDAASFQKALTGVVEVTVLQKE
ncbi:MAG: MBL fold metallo-hydrolase [Deltaproteobacteria bacterium]|nr:MBL fold metallo-hydrolase [Deltaproteobacteria bacterium]